MLVTKHIASLLIIDDSPLQLKILSDALDDTYKIKTASSGREALDMLASNKVDIILSDVLMPEMDGFEFYHHLTNDKNFCYIPVIFISSVSDIDAKVKLLDLGAFDYITKPFDIKELKARINSHLLRIRHQKTLENNIHHLYSRLEKQVHEVDSIYDLFYGTIVNIALAKSKETGLHLVRTKYYLARLLKKYLQIYPVPVSFDECDQNNIIEHIMQAATMHDIGKVGIPDHILMKPGKLTADEYALMKTHTMIGYEMLSSSDISINNHVLNYAKQVVRYHHERWDGYGYPDGLTKYDIPFPARLMAIADVYDALISRRIYKEPIPHNAAVKIILGDSGKSFDPVLVDIFLNENREFLKIAKQYQDKDLIAR